MKKQVHNDPTEAYFFLIKHVSEPIKIKNHIPLCTKRAKSNVDGAKRINKTIEHINEKIQSGITSFDGG